ncbi:MAG: hypothetical protein L0211_00865 [Planctomycetaceae bacterium]|nr:hypothetical protein [Planctomycetaceae bacterium]
MPAATSPSLDLHGLTRRELAGAASAWGFSAASAARIWRYLYREGAASIEDMSELPPRLRSRLASEARLQWPSVAAAANSSDGLTRKYLLRLADGREIETVRMRFRGRTTVCLSTQAGCAWAASFAPPASADSSGI